MSYDQVAALRGVQHVQVIVFEEDVASIFVLRRTNR